MNLFNKKVLKIKSDSIDKGIKFTVNYYKVKEESKFKSKLLSEISGNNTCLAIMDTRLLQKDFNRETDKEINSLADLLKELKIKHSIISIKAENDIEVLGLKVKVDSKRKNKDYAAAFVIRKDSFEKLGSMLSKFNIYYFFDNKESTAEELLNKFNLGYQDMDELAEAFAYNIFDNSFLKQLVVTSTLEASKFVSGVIDEFQDYK